MTITSLLALIAINVVGVISPGPDIVLILRTATRSRRHALAVTLGIQIGVLMWCTLTVLGAAAVLHAFPQLVGVIQVVGGAWLMYMGYGLARSGWRERMAPPQDVEAAAEALGGLATSIRQGLLTNLSNPKIVLYLAAIVAPILPANPSALMAVAVVLTLSLSSFAVQMTIAYVVSTRRIRRTLLAASPFIDLGAGIFFLIASVVLIVRGIAVL